MTDTYGVDPTTLAEAEAVIATTLRRMAHDPEGGCHANEAECFHRHPVHLGGHDGERIVSVAYADVDALARELARAICRPILVGELGRLAARFHGLADAVYRKVSRGGRGDPMYGMWKHAANELDGLIRRLSQVRCGSKITHESGAVLQCMQARGHEGNHQTTHEQWGDHHPDEIVDRDGRGVFRCYACLDGRVLDAPGICRFCEAAGINAGP